MKRNSTLQALIIGCALGVAVLADAAEVIVRVAPPPPMNSAVIGVRPGPRYVWTSGYYRWSGRAYVWVPGRWMIPPRSGVVWVAPHWSRRGGGYVYVPGYWR